MVIVDDHQLVSDGLGMLLDGEPDMEVCGYGRTVAEAIRLAHQTDPDLVVMDFHLPDGTGLDAAIAIRRVRPDMRFVFLTRDDSVTARVAAVEAGAGAFVHKSRAASDLIEAVRQVGNGASLISPSMIASLLSRNGQLGVKRDSLTAREREVLRLMAEGASSREIADRLGISYATVRSHIRSFDTKLGVHSKIEAVAAAREMNIIE
ncbi:MAG: response regulator transcription factor [Chloroflexi bacterium]|nr:MAG: response regulator transcription factor [Chloroflexota bacterium]TME57932.1 MAG: response regulator transcription factor [Chloroflexota bacterium]